MPNNIPDAKGVFFGVELKHERAHFTRAIMESVAYMIKEYVEFLGVNVTEIRSMGGGAKSDLWCTIKSQVLDKSIVTLKENETACLGSAIFAGVGLKVFDSINGACENLINKNKTYKSQNAEYGKIYKEYKIKEKKLLQIF
jgi:xylulokinase